MESTSPTTHTGPGPQSENPKEIERRKTAPTVIELLLLTFFAFAPRVVAALWLPNAFGDAYAYTEQIYYMRRALLSGDFNWSNLFGFWLPLYQFLCAAISAVVGSPYLVPKIVSAVAGAVVCLLVYLLALHLTRNEFVSRAVFAIVVLNPYHIHYSASAMTDVPHALTILLVIYCCLRNRWFLASICVFLACMIRVESWLLIISLPLLQFAKERRVSLPGLLFLLAGPILWLYISQVGGGSPWKYFEIRNEYIVQTLAGNPFLQSFSPRRLALDFGRLIYTCNPIIVAACVAILFWLRRMRSTHKRNLCRGRIKATGLLVGSFFGNLAFLTVAYFTNNQPEIWPRYGLILFVLGLPLLAQQVVQLKPGRLTANNRFVAAAAVLFGIQFCIQLVDVTRLTIKNDPHQLVAEFLGDERLVDDASRIYCEDGTIRVMSGIPLEEFADQYNSPKDTETFLRSLRERRIRYLIYKDLPGSDLAQKIRRINAGRSGVALQEVAVRPRPGANQRVVVYRVHTGEVAEHKPKASRRK